MVSFIVQVQPECTRHDDCQDTQICHQGSCRSACQFERCGVNAACKASNHVARCECLPGYQGDNPNRGCKKREYFGDVCMGFAAACLTSFTAPPTEPSLATGCSRNSECPDYNACENQNCINPCAVRDPCSPLATCRVVSHEAVCTCPDGFLGSPKTDCILRKS